jgi:hypothetical protein
MAVPCYVDILACRNGSSTTGDVSIRLIAEQDPGLNSLRVFATLVQDDVPGSGYWAGSTFPYAFRENLFGVAGPAVEFSAPYPDTLFFEAPYELEAGWTASNMYLVTFVQEYSTTDKEVANSRIDNFLGLPTGTGDGGGAGDAQPAISISPNPAAGIFTVSTGSAGASPATLTVFDLSGRAVFTGDASGGTVQVEIEQTGIYIARLSTPDGSTASKAVAIIR